jgi:hypothetical protein
MQAKADFFQYVFGNRALAFAHGAVGLLHPIIEAGQIEFGQFGDVFIGNFKPEAFFFQAGPVAFGANSHGHKIFGPLADFFAAAVEYTSV